MSEVTTFGQAVTLVSGFPFASSKFNKSGAGIPLIRIRDVSRGFSETFFDGPCPVGSEVVDGDFLIGMDGDFSIAKWRGGMAALNQRVMKLGIAHESVDVRFAALWLEPKLKEIEDSTSFTTVKHLSSKSVKSLPFQPPPLEEQRRIVDLIDALESAIEAADAYASSLGSLHSEMLVRYLNRADEKWETMPLGTVMSLDVEIETVQEDISYPAVGVLNRGRGILRREPVSSTSTKYTKLNRVRSGQIIYSKLKAFEGAITVVPDGEMVRFASGEFPTFSCGPSLSPEYFRLISQLPTFWERLASLSKGMGGRRERLSPSDFLGLRIAIPPVGDQIQAIAVAGQTEVAHRAAAAFTEALRHLRTNLLAALLSGEHEIPSSYDEHLGVVA